MSEEPWAESLAVLSRYYVGSATLGETLQDVSELAVATVPGADFVGLTMIVEGRQRTAVFTDPDSPEIDQAQYDSGEGPCVDAFEHGRVNIIDSADSEVRWPAFCAAARDHGILSTMSLPMAVEGRTFGAMNFYSDVVCSFSQRLVDEAVPFATQAAIVLANSQAYWNALELGERLSQAMEFRSVIEQAKGVLMGAQRCSADEAFEVLVAASQRENVRVREIARRIVARAART